MTFPIPARGLIPHRGGMCCIDTILSVELLKVQASVVLDADHLLLNGGRVLDRSGFIELAAQAACALKGTASAGRGSATALLASVNNFQVYDDARIGETLLIRVEITTELAAMSLLNFNVVCGQRLLATGQLKVFYRAEH